MRNRLLSYFSLAHWSNLPRPLLLLSFFYTITIAMPGLGMTATDCPIPNPAASAIVSMEYFFDDNDPGPGNGIPISIPPGSTTAVQISLPGIATANLTTGSHLFFVRAQDNTGCWGPTRQGSFEMPFAGVSISPVFIDSAEYFFDQDPGPGHGTPIPVPPGGQLDGRRKSVSVSGVDLSALPLGPHTLYVRMRGSDGIWGPASSAGSSIASPGSSISSPPLFNFEVSGTPTIAAMEYFIDTDPGAGKGIPLPLPGVSGSIFQSAIKHLSTDLLSLGPHTFYLRAKDGDGRWGPSHQQGFEIISTTKTISGAEFFVDLPDPGVGAGTSLAPTDGAFDEGAEQVQGTLNTSSLSPGSHQIFVRARSSDGQWSSKVGQGFTIGPAQTPVITSLSPTSGIVGSSVTITGSNFGALQGSSKATFNGATAPIFSWSDTTIQATVPMGAATGPVPVVVTSNGVASNADKIFTVIPPPPPPPVHSIAGTVTLNGGAGLFGVTLTLGGAAGGTAATSANGTYSFTNLLDGTYIIMPVLNGYCFTPSSRLITLTGADASGQDFSAKICPSDFTLQITQISPPTSTVIPGETLTFNVSVGSINGLDALVVLSKQSISPSDQSIKVDFDRTDIFTGNSAQMTTTTTTSTPVNSYVITIQGTNGAITHTAQVNINVTSPPDPFCSLTHPNNELLVVKGTLKEFWNNSGNNLIILHGVCSSHAAFLGGNDFIEYFKTHGNFTNILFYDYPSGELIENNASILAGEIFRNNKTVKFDVVAHSMGGLVARWLNEKYILKFPSDFSNNIKNLIMVGTPNFGAPAANIATFFDILIPNLPSGGELIENSDFLKCLNSNDDLNCLNYNLSTFYNFSDTKLNHGLARYYWYTGDANGSLLHGFCLPFNSDCLVPVPTSQQIAYLSLFDQKTFTSNLFLNTDYSHILLHENCAINGICDRIIQALGVGPDLVMPLVLGPSSGVTGSNIIITSRVKNQGNLSTGSGFSVGLYLSLDSTITTADTFLGSRPSPVLSPGAIDQKNTSVTIPMSVAPGTYFLGAIADDPGVIAETNEGNNSKAGNTITIAAGTTTTTTIPPPPPPPPPP